MSLSHEVFELASIYPDGITHPVEMVATLGATALAVTGIKITHKRRGEKLAEAFGGNQELAEKAVVNVRGGKETRVSRRRRLAPVLGLVTGAGVALSGFLGQPTHKIDHPSEAAKTVIVSGASLSMRRTRDLGDNITRYEAVVDGLRAVRNYDGSLAVVSSGANNEVTIPLGRGWRQSMNTLQNPAIDQNGNDTAGAINLATNLLPLNEQGKRSGNIVVIDDGVADSSGQDMQRAVQSARHSGVGLRAIVVGGSNGSYTVDHESNPSGAQPQAFDAFGSSHVRQATSTAEVASDIDAALSSVSYGQPEQEPWPWMLVAGIGIAAISGGALTKRAIERS